MPSNNVKILDAIRAGKGAYSKKDIAKICPVSWGTMCKTVGGLIDRNIVFGRKEKSNTPGRPSVPLCVNPGAAVFVGFDVGAEHTKVVFCDLNFQVLYQEKITTEHYTTPEAFCRFIAREYRSALTAAGAGVVDEKKVIAVGLAISGNVDSEQGMIVSGGNFGMRYGANIPAERIAGLLERPVYTVTTQVAAAAGEYHFGRRKGCGNLVTIGLGVGIGSGIVANHQLLYSHPRRPIGYIGHILIPGNEHVCSCGFKGCLEAFSGGNYLAEIAREHFPQRHDLHRTDALDRAAAAGDPAARSILETAAAYNAVGVASMIQLYAPEALIFSGGQSRRDGFLFLRTIEKLKEILPPERRNCFIDITVLGEYQSALGAAQQAYEHYF